MVQVAVSAPDGEPVTPVTPDTGSLVVVIEPVPVEVHKPVPTVGVFPAKVKVDVLHLFWSVPAFAVVTVA